MSAQPLFPSTARVSSTAVLSPCGTWRYRLTRRWADGGVVLWVMLNPSTADADQDDPTIRRCVGFARAWGYGAIEVVNLYALRTAYPVRLLDHPDPVGPDGDAHLSEAFAGRPGLVVAAWGGGARRVGRRRGARRDERVRVMAGEAGLALHCLGTTRAGAPRHPLYVPAGKRPEPWRGAA